MAPILRAERLGRAVHGKTLVEDATFEVGTGEVYAAIYQFVVMAMIFALLGLTSLVSTVLIRGRIFSPAEQLLLQRQA